MAVKSPLLQTFRKRPASTQSRCKEPSGTRGHVESAHTRVDTLGAREDTYTHASSHSPRVPTHNHSGSASLMHARMAPYRLEILTTNERIPIERAQVNR
jgi:hypothetical protein